MLSGVVDVLPSSFLVSEPLQKSPNCGTDYNGNQVIHFTAALKENKFTPAIDTLNKSWAVRVVSVFK